MPAYRSSQIRAIMLRSHHTNNLHLLTQHLRPSNLQQCFKAAEKQSANGPLKAPSPKSPTLRSISGAAILRLPHLLTITFRKKSKTNLGRNPLNPQEHLGSRNLVPSHNLTSPDRRWCKLLFNGALLFCSIHILCICKYILLPG